MKTCRSVPRCSLASSFACGLAAEPAAMVGVVPPVAPPTRCSRLSYTWGREQNTYNSDAPQRQSHLWHSLLPLLKINGLAFDFCPNISGLFFCPNIQERRLCSYLFRLSVKKVHVPGQFTGVEVGHGSLYGWRKKEREGRRKIDKVSKHGQASI